MTALPHLPDPVRATLEGFVAATQSAFGAELRSIVLYGSAAEGRMRATSDVNVIVVLRSFVRERADALREPLRFARAAVDLKAMFVLEAELGDAAREFAQKFADARRRHVVLYGDDPFATLEISRDALVRRLQQVTLNLTLRLRDQYLETSLREEQAAIAVAEATGPLRAAAASILELEGEGTFAPKEALEKLAGAQFAELLPHLSEAREQRALPAGSAARHFFTTLELAQALHERAHRL